jgi:hypothetical protein
MQTRIRMEKLLEAVAVAIVFGGGGLVLLLRPRWIQRLAIERQDDGCGKPILSFFVQSASYLSFLRLFGVLCILAAWMLLAVAYRTFR